MNIKFVMLLMWILNANAQNLTSVLEDCKSCISDGQSAFYKHVYYAAGQPRYSCMRFPPRSNLSWIVGRWCNADECSELDLEQPVKRVLQPEELDCGTGLKLDVDNFPPLLIKANSSLYFNTYQGNGSLIMYSGFVFIYMLGSLFLWVSIQQMHASVRKVRPLLKNQKNYALRNRGGEGYDTVG